jgi:two-component system, chemotaxis family, chemotaxis protein CheY
MPGSLEVDMAKVLFCEDSPIIQKLILFSMRGTSHEVFVSADGTDGMVIVEQQHPDLVFTDLHMPGMDGITLTRTIKEHADAAHIPVILLTASGEADSIDEGYRVGISSHILKPFSPATLRQVVAEWSARRVDLPGISDGTNRDTA